MHDVKVVARVVQSDTRLVNRRVPVRVEILRSGDDLHDLADHARIQQHGTKHCRLRLDRVRRLLAQQIAYLLPPRFNRVLTCAGVDVLSSRGGGHPEVLLPMLADK